MKKRVRNINLVPNNTNYQQPMRWEKKTHCTGMDSCAWVERSCMFLSVGVRIMDDVVEQSSSMKIGTVKIDVGRYISSLFVGCAQRRGLLNITPWRPPVQP
jgi:hypothetical protein